MPTAVSRLGFVCVSPCRSAHGSARGWRMGVQQACTGLIVFQTPLTSSTAITNRPPRSSNSMATISLFTLPAGGRQGLNQVTRRS